MIFQSKATKKAQRTERLRRFGRAVKSKWPEALLSGAWLSGYALLLWGVSSATGWEWVWKIGAGLLLLSMGGWRLLFLVATEGLYLLSRDDNSQSKDT